MNEIIRQDDELDDEQDVESSFFEWTATMSIFTALRVCRSGSKSGFHHLIALKCPRLFNEKKTTTDSSPFPYKRSMSHFRTACRT